ncbi:MAG: rRNA pseudouridine synthase [Lachnospiraceae bacterium]|nr:rRNA pseudouridine synthase [Lachnospiraceae bacterium]
MRLDKFLADMGEGSRSQVKEAIRKGRVLLNGKIIKNPEEKVKDTDEVLMDQRKITYTSMEYFMLYKPAGILSASKDRMAPTVLDLITEKKRKDLFPVGRLDKDTEGLLLITNDGMLAHKLLSPHNHVPKIYFVRVNGMITDEIKQQFQTGIVMDKGEIALPANIKLLSCKEAESEAELTIYEGKFHQVKRMFAAVGLMVLYLKRLSMGSLILDESLGKGGFRPLSRREIEELKG